MNIALTLLSGVGYGGMTYFQNLIPALAAVDRINEYHLFAPHGHPLIGAVWQKNFIFHECAGKNPSALKRFLWEQCVLPRELKKYKVDILFTAKNLNVFFAPCKTIISGRNMEPFAYHEYHNDWKLNMISWAKWQLTKWSVRKADHIVAVSQAVKDRLMKKFPGIEKKVTVVYNGNPVGKNPKSEIRNPKQIQNPNNQNSKRLEFGISNLDIVSNFDIRYSNFILTASKFVAYANQLHLLKGYSLLVKSNPKTPPLWFAGGVHDKKYFQTAKKYVEDAGLKERVRFLGLLPHDELLTFMRAATAFIFPSTLESCPHTLIEAMACGVPIATSNVPPMPEICDNAAVYFDPHDPEDIAIKIALILSDVAIRERLHSASPFRAGDFTWEKTARELITVFTSVYKSTNISTNPTNSYS